MADEHERFQLCVNCGHDFGTPEEADLNNWVCAGCDHTITGIADPFDDRCSITPTGVLIVLVVPDKDDGRSRGPWELEA